MIRQWIIKDPCNEAFGEKYDSINELIAKIAGMDNLLSGEQLSVVDVTSHQAAADDDNVEMKKEAATTYSGPSLN